MKPVRIDFEQTFCGLRLSLLSLERVSFFCTHGSGSKQVWSWFKHVQRQFHISTSIRKNDHSVVHTNVGNFLYSLPTTSI